MKVLFIGNSHTYYNDMPHVFAEIAERAGHPCGVTMLAHPGWYLEQHAADPEARFNILYGGYDYVVLQENSHIFAYEEKYLAAFDVLNGWIREAGSSAVIYGNWAKKDKPERQPEINRICAEAAQRFGALYAPVGEIWLSGEDLFAEDGRHPSPAGSRFAAETIWAAIENDTHPGGK